MINVHAMPPIGGGGVGMSPGFGIGIFGIGNPIKAAIIEQTMVQRVPITPATHETLCQNLFFVLQTLIAAERGPREAQQTQISVEFATGIPEVKQTAKAKHVGRNKIAAVM